MGPIWVEPIQNVITKVIFLVELWFANITGNAQVKEYCRYHEKQKTNSPKNVLNALLLSWFREWFRGSIHIEIFLHSLFVRWNYFKNFNEWENNKLESRLQIIQLNL